MNGIRTQKGLAAKLIAAAIALAAAIGIIMPTQNAWAEGEGDFTLTVQKHWVSADTGEELVDVPFDKLDVVVRQYYKVTENGVIKDVFIGDAQVVELKKTEGWTNTFKISGVESYGQFKVTGETAYTTDEEGRLVEVDLAAYGLTLTDGYDFESTFVREYVNAGVDGVVKVPSCSAVKYEVPGHGFTLAKMIETNTYVIWMPYMENLTPKARWAIEDALIAANDQFNGAPGLTHENMIFGDEPEAVNKDLTVTYLPTGKTELSFTASKVWALAFYGGFSFESPVGELSFENPLKMASIPVLKNWVDEGFEGLRPGSVVIGLYANDELFDTLELTAEGGWAGLFDRLPVCDSAGNPISYAVKEISDLGNYDPVVSGDAENGFVITNTLSKTDASVAKKVTGNMGDVTKPFGFLARLHAGDDVTDFDFTLTDGESYSFGKLPLGAELWIKEVDSTGYQVIVTDAAGNTCEPTEDGWYKIPVGMDLSITFENNKNVDIDTGVSLMDKPYFFALVGLALAALAAGAVAVSRKRFLND